MSMRFRWLDFKITNRCNNNCIYCGGKNDPPSAPELLAYNVIKNTLQDALDAKFNYICFLGGEPSIRRDIVDIIKIIENAEDIHLRIITNLKIFRKEMYEALFSTKSCDVEIVTSFDNFSYPNYKRVDPKTSMKRIELINKLAKKYEKRFQNGKKRSISLHSVISRENYYKIGELVEYFYDKGIDVSLGLVCPSIFTENPKNYNEFRKKDITSIIHQLNHLEILGKLNFANCVLKDFLQVYTFGEFSHKSNCWAGRKQVIINTDGEVFPCISESYLSSKRYGNIKNERFRDILKKLNDFKCSMHPTSACWDHFLWDQLAKKVEEEENN